MPGCASSSRSSRGSKRHVQRWSAFAADRDVPAARRLPGPAGELPRSAGLVVREAVEVARRALTRRSSSFAANLASRSRRSPNQWESSPITYTESYPASSRRGRSSETGRAGWRPDRAVPPRPRTAQINSSCFTALRSSFNSLTVMSIREREKSSISSPCTI